MTITFDLLPEIVGEEGCSAGALHLSRWLLDNTSLIQGTRVLELGCGMALPSIAALKAGAAYAYALDNNGGALEDAKRLARNNDLEVSWTALHGALMPIDHVPEQVRFDWVIGACLFDWAPELEQQFVRLSAAGSETLYATHANLKPPGDYGEWRRIAVIDHVSKAGGRGEVHFWEVDR